MESKTMASMIAIIMVLNACQIQGTNVVQSQPHSNHAISHSHHNAGALSKTLTTLCASATYKEACIKSLESVAHNQKATPQTYVETGIRLALDEMNKASKLTDTLIPKANVGKKPQMVISAIKTCKHLLNQAKERLEGAMTQVCDANNFKDQSQIFDLRIRLGDVDTFATSCLDEISQAGAPEIQQIIKAVTTHGTQLSVDMLDIVTIFNQALAYSSLPQPSVITTRRLLASF